MVLLIHHAIGVPTFSLHKKNSIFAIVDSFTFSFSKTVVLFTLDHSGSDCNNTECTCEKFSLLCDLCCCIEWLIGHNVSCSPVHEAAGTVFDDTPVQILICL